MSYHHNAGQNDTKETAKNPLKKLRSFNIWEQQ
jgi:hypothetical protein